MQTCPVCRGSDRTEPLSAVVGSQTVIGNNIGNIIGVAYVPNGITPVVGINRTVMSGP
jgi:hypothetical protein